MSYRMIRTAASALASMAMAWLPQIAAAAEAGESAPDRPLHREALDDPPAALRARDRLEARTPTRDVSVGFYSSVQVNIDEFGQNIVGDAANEPSITVNPTDPDNIVIGWRQFDSIASNFRQGGWAFSKDGGQSWTFPGVLTPGVFRSDPVLDADSSGNLYYQSLQFDFNLDVFKSTDGGMTWGDPVPSSAATRTGWRSTGPAVLARATSTASGSASSPVAASTPSPVRPTAARVSSRPSTWRYVRSSAPWRWDRMARSSPPASTGPSTRTSINT